MPWPLFYLRSQSARDKKAGESDRDQVFQQGDENVFDVQRGDQTPSDFVTSECSDYSADSAQNRADDQRLITGRAKADTAKTAREDAGPEWERGCAFWRLRLQ